MVNKTPAAPSTPGVLGSKKQREAERALKALQSQQQQSTPGPRGVADASTCPRLTGPGRLSAVPATPESSRNARHHTPATIRDRLNLLSTATDNKKTTASGTTPMSSRLAASITGTPASTSVSAAFARRLEFDRTLIAASASANDSFTPKLPPPSKRTAPPPSATDDDAAFLSAPIFVPSNTPQRRNYLSAATPLRQHLGSRAKGTKADVPEPLPEMPQQARNLLDTTKQAMDVRRGINLALP